VSSPTSEFPAIGGRVEYKNLNSCRRDNAKEAGYEECDGELRICKQRVVRLPSGKRDRPGLMGPMPISHSFERAAEMIEKHGMPGDFDVRRINRTTFNALSSDSRSIVANW
jgi:hypothetical protein